MKLKQFYIFVVNPIMAIIFVILSIVSIFIWIFYYSHKAFELVVVCLLGLLIISNDIVHTVR